MIHCCTLKWPTEQWHNQHLSWFLSAQVATGGSLLEENRKPKEESDGDIQASAL